MKKSQLSFKKLYSLAMDFNSQRFYENHKNAKTKFGKDLSQRNSDYDLTLLADFLGFVVKNHK
jgi:hypothetical protein